MANNIIVLLLCLIKIWEGNLMSLKGPALTKYDPCGLGLIHFDRISRNYWQGVLHYGLYFNLNEAEILVTFEKESTVYAYPKASTVALTKINKTTLMVHSKKPMPDKYIFFVTLDNLSQNDSDVPVVSILTMNNVTLCNDIVKASQTITSLNVTKQFPGKPNVNAHVCGRRSLNNEELVSVRTEARPGDWPWHIAMFIKDINKQLKYQCGGSIVSSTTIITAGHCVFNNGVKLDASSAFIVAGSNNHTDINHVGRQALNAYEIVLHPAYNFDYSTSDLAIIRVNRLQFTEYVQPICVWGPVYDKTDLFGKEATVVGFGSTEYNKQSNILRAANTMVQHDNTCIHFAPKVYSKLLNEFTFCAGYGPMAAINPRNGDSGGGLVIPIVQSDHKISWHLRGVLSKCGISLGHKECDPTFYVVYTDVAPHYGWIYHHAGLQYRSNIVTL